MVKVEKKSHYSIKACGGFKFNIKDVDSSSRTVTGFYNTFNFLDYDGDVLLPGCAKVSIRMRGPKSNAVAKIKHACDHDLTRIPGKQLVLDEREVDGVKGVYFETRMADTILGNDTLKNYMDGIIDNHSIGFQYMNTEFIERDAKGWDKMADSLLNPEALEGRNCVWVVKEIMMYEGSSVAFGANQLTPFLGMAKSMNKESIKLALFDRMNKLQSTLKSGHQSDEMMELFDIQVLQLKQMLEELSDGLMITGESEREKADVSRETKDKEKEKSTSVSLLSSSLVENFSLK